MIFQQKLLSEGITYAAFRARNFDLPGQSGGYDRFLSQEFAKMWYLITERGGTERRCVLCDRRKLVVRSHGSNMAAAEAKLSFDLAVDSVRDSLEPKFILKV